jgi:hypothetical protein
MSGFWEIEASVSPARDVLADGSEEMLVRVRIVDHDNADPGVSEEPCKRDRKDCSCLQLHLLILI